MSRTAEPAACQPKRIYSLVLLIIAFCMVTHFLVEDNSLHRAGDTTYQSCITTGLTCDEMEHQDDLVVAAGLPASIPHNVPPAILAGSICLERQFAFPIRIPPKIA